MLKSELGDSCVACSLQPHINFNYENNYAVVFSTSVKHTLLLYNLM